MIGFGLFLITILYINVEAATKGCGTSPIQLAMADEDKEFPIVDKFEQNTDCTIEVKAPAKHNSKIAVKLLESTLKGSKQDCNTNYIQIAATSNALNQATKLCDVATATIEPITGDKLFMKIVVADNTGEPKFKLKFQSMGANDGCKDNAVKLESKAQEVSFPLEGTFSSFTNCKIIVTAPEGTSATTVTLVSSNISGEAPTCAKGYFQIASDKTDISTTDKYCGPKPFEKLVIDGAALVVQVNMQGIDTAPTFKLLFTSGVQKIFSSFHMLLLSISIQLVLSA